MTKFVLDGKEKRLKKFRKFLNSMIGIVFHRAVIVGLLIFLQTLWFFAFLTRIAAFSPMITVLLNLLSFLAVIAVVNTRDNPAYKIAYVIMIFSFPLFGGMMYLLFSGRPLSKKLRQRMELVERKIKPLYQQNPKIEEELFLADETAAGQSAYVRRYAGFPIWSNTSVRYFPCGEENYPVLLEELKNAQHFIFLEYFIVSEGQMWNSILDILKEKAAAGVDVRMIYDDLGSVFSLPYRYDRVLESYGIKCEAFNRFVPFVSMVMNNRDHRKILVIDGHTAFTGGINLSDEYINHKNKFGYWKDTGIMVKGDAAVNLTAMFLTLWNAIRPTDTDFSELLPHTYHSELFAGDGFVQPYADSPLDAETVGENVYLNLIFSAKRYLYIFTPYLIIDNEMMTALGLAAKRGVDVCIVTPGQPDKKLVYLLTQSYYRPLIESGVKIYQFQPGFIHAKVFVCDDCYATVGTINLDYRSLYLHFECGVFLIHCNEIKQIRKDAVETMKQSRRITENETKRSLPVRLAQVLLRIFAPIL